MAIGRTEDRNTPGNPLGHVPRRDVWGPIRVTHLGPRSTRPHIKAGHMTAIDQTRPQLQQVLAKRGPSTQGFRMRRISSGDPGKEPASESLRRRNPRESDERLAVYGDLARQELWQGMVFAGSLRAESR
jgi:hypothetical protein